MKKSLLGLLISLLAFFCGILTAGIFRVEQKPIPKPVFEKEITDIPIFKSEPIAKQNPTKVEQSEIEEPTSYIPTPSGIYFPENENGLDAETALILDISENDNGKKETFAEVKVGKNFYRGSFEKVTEKVFIFETEKINGVSYKFNGSFLRNGFENRFEDQEIALQGTLQKFRNNKKIFELKKSFSFTTEVCAWSPNNQ